MLKIEQLLILVIISTCTILAADEWTPVPVPNGVSTVRVNGLDIAIKEYNRDTGIRSALVLYGLNGSIRMMDAFAPLAGSDLHIVAIDLPGHGHTASIPGPLSIELVSGYINSILDSLSLDSVDIIGYSQGGIQALDYYSRYPDRVSKLVFWNSSSCFTSNNERQRFFKNMGKLLERDFYGLFTGPLIKLLSDRYLSPELYEYAMGIALKNHDRSVIEYFVSATSYDGTAILESIDRETMVIGCRFDILAPLWQVKRIHEGIPGSSLVVLNKHGHLSLITDPVYFGVIISEFLVHGTVME
jgi:pimeloyl-ACP methyl ester carboxylesterase